MNKKTSIIIVTMLLFFIICVGASSATIEMLNIEQGDFIWGTINVNTPGLVSVNAWTNGSGSDKIGLYLYNQTGNIVASKIDYHQTSIDYISPNDGTYTVKAYLDLAYGGGTRSISVSGNHQLSLMPKYYRIAFDIAQGNAIWYDISVNRGGQAFVNAWTSGSGSDKIGLYLYNQTGNIVASKIDYHQTSIDYISPNDGKYIVKAYLDLAYGGGTRTISVSTNHPFESGPPSGPIAQTPTTSSPTTMAIPTTKLGSGSILVTSFPSGAGIYINETYEGETPKILTNLPQGSPTIILKLEGYKDWQQNIDIASGNTSYIPVALESSTTSSRLTPEDENRLVEKYKKEISSYSKQDKENLVNIQFQEGNKNLANGHYEESKAYFLMAKAISEDLKDQNLVEKAEILLEVVNTKIENKESTKLIYELVLALGAALIFGYIFGDTFEKKMKNKVHKYLIIAVAFLLIFFIFYILGRFI
jgi:hypothetical protein